MSNEQNVREYYMLNQRIRDLFYYKKGLFFFKSILCPSGCERRKEHKKPATCPIFDWIREMTSDK